MTLIDEITENARETMVKQSKERLIKKFSGLQNKSKEGKSNSFEFIKNPVLNLAGDEISESHQEVLNLRQKFVPNPQRIHYMDIITTTESSSLKLNAIDMKFTLKSTLMVL